MVMGERGLMARIICPKFGGYLTFGTLESGIVSAPGKPTIDDLVNLYNFRQIRPDRNTKVFGIIGKPVGHSKSPILYNEAFKKVGVLPFLISCAIDFLLDDIKRSIEAVNCIVRKSDGKFFGCSTDYVGAITAIEDALGGLQHVSGTVVSPLAGKLLVIGADGAGKALAYGTKAKGAKVVLNLGQLQMHANAFVNETGISMLGYSFINRDIHIIYSVETMKMFVCTIVRE
ncbi:hypothetical protein ACSBR1_013771 [Camellia fascicularis]